MAKCAACCKFMSSKDGAVCSVCPLAYHKACISLPDATVISRTWVCPECNKKRRKGDNSSTPVKSAFEDAQESPDAATSAPAKPSGPTRLRSTDALIENLRRDLTADSTATNKQIEALRRDLSTFIAEEREFRRELRGAIAGLTERVDGIERRLEAVENREAAAGPAPAPGAGLAQLEGVVAQLRTELDEREQEALLADLDIGMLPEAAGESAMHAVTVVAQRLGVRLEERDVVFAERVGARPAEGGRPRRLIVRLARRRLRDELLAAARARRAVTAPDAGAARVYINERLTRRNRQLFHRAREECRARHWRYVWTRRGRVYVRQGDGKPVYPIRCDADLDVALKAHPA